MRSSFANTTRAPRHVVVRAPADPTNTSSRRTLDSQQRLLVVLESLVSVCGLGGGTYMVSHPLTTMPLSLLDGTWFHTWRWPGVALLFFVGFCPALSVLATLQRRRIELVCHIAVGVGLVVWILIEAAWIVVSPGLQITFAAVGVIIVALAISEVRRRTVDGHV